jgi:hypothetical protein
MEEMERPRRGTSAIRLLAAALAGAFGAFGMPGVAHHAATTTPPAATTSAARAPDVNPE